MNDPFRNLDRLQRQLGHIAFELTHVQFSHALTSHGWRPAVNAYRCADRFIICVDLAGTDKAAIEVTAEPLRLTIRGTRPAPGPNCDQPQPAQVLAMEIDHGPFERVLNLPSEVDTERVVAEYREGLLWIQLHLRAHA